MSSEYNEYKRLSHLGVTIMSGAATGEEKNEYMEYIYSHNGIDKEFYDSYKAGVNTEKILNAALSIGGIFLIKYLIMDLFSKRNNPGGDVCTAGA